MAVASTKFIDEIFKTAVAKGASDIHIVEGMPPLIRVDGSLQKLTHEAELSAKETADICYGLCTAEQKEVFDTEKELDLGYQIDDVSRFRINLYWERGSAGLVARVISPVIPTMAELNMPAITYDLCRLKQGLVLVTGPTGMGKSTTLAAMIDLINSEQSVNIVTLEDPIEFIYKPKKAVVKQRQLGTDMMSFAQGLKHVLRQDPNVIMVGEMRDLETIASTITLAETGHLVLATLHTLNAAQTIDRIIDVFPPYQQAQVRLQISLFLKGIISQQLLPGANGGRVAAREVLINSPAIANLIRENKVPQIKTALQTSAEDGMFTMDQNIKKLYADNIITEETATAFMVNPADLK
jgi:twitching motility protein PilT